MERGSGIELVVDGLAVWRLTHLVVEDGFPPVARARDAVMDRLGPDHPISYLVTCTYCSGVWVAAGVVAARTLAPRAWRLAARTAALAAAAPLIEAAVAWMEEG